jgi:uncharacterized damage-inducible protein DinB
MKTLTCAFVSIFVLGWNSVAPAQTTKSPEHTTASQVADYWITNTEQHVVAAADAMPADKYDYAPTNGAFQGVRTFAEQVKHLAANNYRMAAKIMGQKPTSDQEDETGPETVNTKVEIMEYLKGSFTALHKAMATMNDHNLTEPIPGMSGTWQKARLGLAIDAVAHSFDHYGQMVEYLRMNGIIPPGSK